MYLLAGMADDRLEGFRLLPQQKHLWLLQEGHVSQTYEQEKIIFPWQEGDVMLLDNMSVAHGREPYVGEREVIVAMTDVVDGSDA